MSRENIPLKTVIVAMAKGASCKSIYEKKKTQVRGREKRMSRGEREGEREREGAYHCQCLTSVGMVCLT